jgi:radical SAM protein with 4Fe4S-binding SPASM domain
MRVWGRPPFIILECDEVPDKLRETQLQCFPFCITYQVQESDDVAALNRIVDAGLSGGAKFVLFDLSDDHIGIGTVPPLEMAAQKMEILQTIQKAHPPMKVQIRVRGLPLPKHVLAADLTVKQILGQILGGCSAGLFLGGTRSTSCDHTASPDELAAIGPVLPPNCCQAGMTHMAIDRNGAVYPCEQAIGDHEMAIDSTNVSSLRDIWNSEKWAFYRGGWDLCDLEGCYRCGSYIACGVRRCRVHAAQTSGDTHGPMSACLKSKNELGISIVSGKKAR